MCPAKVTARGPRLAAVPDERMLREYALASLARHSLSRKGLLDTLERKIGNWVRRAIRAGRDAEMVERDAERARSHVEPIVDRFVEVGLIDDVRFAAARAGRLGRAGKSTRAIAFHLKQKGIDEGTVRRSVSSDPDDEFRAALVLARRRRIGPFSRVDENVEREARRAARTKAMATLARAGFDFGVVERVMRVDLEEAQERLLHIGSLQ